MHPPLNTLLRLSLLALFLMSWRSSLALTTYYVSPAGNDNNAGTKAAPYLTIQAAMNNAASGDTVTLSDGTYTGIGNRDLDFAGKDLTVNSVNGAEKTIIDCGGTEQAKYRAFFLHSKEKAANISGLTIKNGYADTGGAIAITDPATTVRVSNCLLTGNTGPTQGAAVSNVGILTLMNCTLVGNQTTGPGGAIYSTGKLIVTGSTIKGNTAKFSGGGIVAENHFTNSTVEITKCTISENQTDGIGGGLMIDNCKTTIVDSVIEKNKAGRSGGLFSNGNMVMTGCTVRGNVAASVGGMECGGYISGCTISDNITNVVGGTISTGGWTTIINCIISNNTAPTGGGILNDSYDKVLTVTSSVICGNKSTAGSGGGIFNKGGAIVLRFCSIYGNSAAGKEVQGASVQGGGLENDAKATLTDCILWGNTAPYANQIGTAPNGNPVTIVTYSDIQGGLSGTGNIKIDPMFMDPMNGDLHLKAGSPCIGTGIAIPAEKPDPKRNVIFNPAPLDPGVPSDINGKAHGNSPSMGAYEGGRTTSSSKEPSKPK